MNKKLFRMALGLPVLGLPPLLSLGAADPVARAAAEYPETIESALPSWEREVVDWSAARAQAAEESLQPIRPGIPGERPFWNGSAPSFTYAPAFDFKTFKGATAYRFTARVVGMKSATLVFEAENPWAPLTPIWKDLPAGEVILQVQGLKEKDGEPIGLAGERRFYRASVFNGPYQAPAFDFRESVRRVCLFQFRSPFFQQFKEARDHYDMDPYPSKFEGTGVIQSMTILARISPRLPEADDALLMARNAARHLIRISRPSGDALAFFPPTYSATTRTFNPALAPECQPDNIMMYLPAQVGDCYLDLFDATNDAEFFQAAVRIAETYRKTQLPGGTWYLMADGRSGKRLGMEMVPMDMPGFNVVDFLDRLGVQYGRREFLPVRDAAVKWIKDNTLRTFDFTGQFEDTGSDHVPYSNLSGNTAAAIASYLFRHANEDPSSIALAEDALRLEEDVFIEWEQPFNRDLFTRPETQFKKDLFTPCAFEQYLCYTSVDCSAAFFMDACLAGYQATAKKQYLAKALSFANAMTVLQEGSGGTIPTWWNPSRIDDVWPNCPALCARMMERFANHTDTLCGTGNHP